MTSAIEMLGAATGPDEALVAARAQLAHGFAEHESEEERAHERVGSEPPSFACEDTIPHKDSTRMERVVSTHSLARAIEIDYMSPRMFQTPHTIRFAARAIVAKPAPVCFAVSYRNRREEGQT